MDGLTRMAMLATADGGRRQRGDADGARAMAAGLADGLFWGSLAFALAVAFAAAVPVNRRLISRGRGHAVVHSHHRPQGA